MAELFRHTDEDGDTLRVVGVDDLQGRPVVFSIDGEPVAIFVERGAALRLAAALVGYYGLEVLTEDQEERRG